MSLASPIPAAMDQPTPRWWSRSFRMFQTNLREIDAGLDVERTLDAIQETGADTWLVNAGGILSVVPHRPAVPDPQPAPGAAPRRRPAR
ncbi:hypothetical protein BJF90_04220 [Pseudonocardia sp. CNS-004]|nr:hypothetical protein BJF90_04220 [Pseudonocardia sp. CNS-004]